MRSRRRVERVSERRHRENRRRERRERCDHPGVRRVEGLCSVTETAHEERDAEHEHTVGDHRPDERGLHDLDQAVMEGEEGDEELRQVAEPGLDDTGGRGADAAAELFGRAADEAREQGDRSGGDQERRDRRHLEKVRERRGHDEEGGERDLPDVVAVHGRY